MACAPDAAEGVLAIFAQQGFGDAAVVGRMAAGAPQVVVD